MVPLRLSHISILNKCLMKAESFGMCPCAGPATDHKWAFTLLQSSFCFSELNFCRVYKTGSAHCWSCFVPGSVYSWGMGTNMQLGTGEEEDEWSPIKITGKQLENRTVLMASSGGQHTALLVKDNQESWFSYQTDRDGGEGGLLGKVRPCSTA